MKAAYYPTLRICNSERQHGDPDHPRNWIKRLNLKINQTEWKVQLKNEGVKNPVVVTQFV